jgi:hypothetical protein
MRFEFQLGEVDQGRYERGSEWFLLDDTWLYDSTVDELDELEKAMGGYRIARLLSELDKLGAKALRAAYWYARRHAGIVETYESFQPHVLRIDWRTASPVGDDADPPVPSPQDASPNSSVDDPSEPPSSTSDPA